MRIIYSKYDKSKIAELPRVLFNGRIFVIQTEAEACKAIDYLSTFQLIGIDTETRPSFKKGVTNKVSLLQLSTDDTCFLFRLKRIGMPDCLKQFFQNESITKVGLSLKDDLLSLRRRGEFEPRSFLDLQQYVKTFGIQDMSLQKLYANVFGYKISKAQRLSNWEADVLTDGQKLYAATDAWACVNLYKELKELRETNDYKLISVPLAEQPTKTEQ